MQRLIILLCLAVTWGGAAAEPAQVQGVRMWPAPDNTRLVFDVTRPVDYKVFTLENPQRLVIDITDTRMPNPLPAMDLDKSNISKIRSGMRDENNLRVVLELKKQVKPMSFVLKPYQNYGHRLVVDLNDPSHDKGDVKNIVKNLKQERSDKPRDVVVAIDAGHGGEDPGAKGYKGTREKVVVLAIAKRLNKLISDEPGMRPVLIRTGDYYIGLRKRMDKARAHKADLFISIHADAFRDHRARGASVYALSQRGASSEAARWLAASENASDLIGGVSLDDKDDMLASVLLDLSQTASIEASLKAGEKVLGKLKTVGPVHKSRVQQAGFMVLKSPDIPSILVETAFISNPREEQNLRSGRFQQSMAVAILKGVREYFNKYPPPGTRLASIQQHKIAKGESLSYIASMYNVSLNKLRKYNDLKSDKIRTGQILKIPNGADS